MKYGKFLKNLTLLFAIIFCADFFLGKVLMHYYFTSRNTANAETIYAIDSTKADVLIFGSSRANHHYDPRIFEKATHLKFYNCGRDGNFIFYHETLLKLITKRYTPKLIILDAVEEELFVTPNSYDRLSVLLPYYENYPEVRPIVNKKSTFENYKMLSRIYPYNSQIISILDGHLSIKGRPEHSSSLKGFIPLKGFIQDYSKDSIRNTAPFDFNKISAFKNFINMCKQKSIPLFIIISPYLKKEVDKSRSVILQKKIAKNFHVKLLDFSNMNEFQSKLNFKDAVHLNETAVPRFDSLVIENIFCKSCSSNL